MCRPNAPRPGRRSRSRSSAARSLPRAWGRCPSMIPATSGGDNDPRRLCPTQLRLSAPSPAGAAIDALAAGGEAAAYPVPRRDSHAWFMVAGDAAARMFAKLCAVDLAPDQFADGRIAQTSVARLSAIVIRSELGGTLAFSLLADSASAEYLWDCLCDAMAEFHGIVAGVNMMSAADRAG